MGRLKFDGYDIVMQEVPGEISLALNITFAEYVLSLKVQIENDQIVSISNVNGSGAEYDKLNDRYISRAADGTKKIAGTIAQILEKQQTDSIDAVSGATCSSDAIVRAVENALEQARKGA